MGRRGIRMGQYHFKLALGIVILYIVLDILNNIVNFFRNDPIKVTLNYIYNNIGMFILALLFTLILVLLRIYQNNKLKEWEKDEKIAYLHSSKTLEDILKKFEYRPTEFEHYVAKLFECNGYKAEVTKATGDGGKDIILYKGKHKFIAEVKRFDRDHKVGRGFLQKLHSAMIDTNVQQAYFVTTSSFTKPAKEFAYKYNIKLIDGDTLVKMINKTIKSNYKYKNRADIESTLLD